MLKVGLTGGIASGKSTVCEIFSRLGAMVLDADEIAREVVQTGQPAWHILRQTFGPEFFHSDGSLSRERLRRLVFADPERRRQLNAIVHPEVMDKIRRRSAEMEARTPKAVLVVDVPLLVEAGAVGHFDRVVLVFVAEEVQLDRLKRREKFSLREARRALEAQLPLKAKVSFADYVIDNGGTLEETRIQVEAVWKDLVALSYVHGGKENQTTEGEKADRLH
jgi:dephospho-CoA kinase